MRCTRDVSYYRTSPLVQVKLIDYCDEYVRCVLQRNFITHQAVLIALENERAVKTCSFASE